MGELIFEFTKLLIYYPLLDIKERSIQENMFQ